MDIIALQTSFERILAQKEAFVEAYYKRLFQDYPQTRTFFVASSPRAREGSLLGTLLSIISLAERRKHFDLAIGVFGLRHEVYGVQSEHYLMVKQVLLETLEQFLGGEWTPTLAADWDEGYTQAMTAMLLP